MRIRKRIRKRSTDELKKLRAKLKEQGLPVGEIDCELARRNRELNSRKSSPMIRREIERRKAQGMPTDQLERELESRLNK